MVKVAIPVLSVNGSVVQARTQLGEAWFVVTIFHLLPITSEGRTHTLFFLVVLPGRVVVVSRRRVVVAQIDSFV